MGFVISSSGDLNSDGAVNLLDLLHVIQQWGPCSIASYCDDTPCDADANFDSAVNVHDLLIVIGAWTG